MTEPRLLEGTDRRSRRAIQDGSHRTEARRDRDRILYSEAFRRLGGVTQVALGGPDMILHNRLTHSLKVEQVGLSIFSKLRSESDVASLADIDAIAAACLAHDLGHPPFGHAGEQELQEILVCQKHREAPRSLEARAEDTCRDCLLEDGFEGNAQSFRILTALAVHKSSFDSGEIVGLDLTVESLRASTKYPWARGDNPRKPKKWGAYDCDVQALDDITGGDASPTLDAQIMDWADDISYAVHDIEDFYRTGHIPIEQYRARAEATEEFLAYATTEGAAGELTKDDRAAFYEALNFFPTRRFSGSAEDFSELDATRGVLLTQFIEAAQLDQSNLRIDPIQQRVNAVLKQFIWYHIIDDPRLTNIQVGQRRVLREIFEILLGIAERTYRLGDSDAPDDRELRRLPHALRRSVTVAFDQAYPGYTKRQRILRGLVDYIAGLSDAEAYYQHAVLKGREIVGHL